MAAAPLPAFLCACTASSGPSGLRDAALAGLCVAWAAFCDAYYAVYCLLIAALYVGSRLLHVEWRPAAATARRVDAGPLHPAGRRR